MVLPPSPPAFSLSTWYWLAWLPQCSGRQALDAGLGRQLFVCPLAEKGVTHCLLFDQCDLRVLHFINLWEGLPPNRTKGPFFRSASAAQWLEVAGCMFSRTFHFSWPRCITVSDIAPLSQTRT